MISRQKLNVLYLMGNQGVNYLMPLLVFPFLMHVLGAEKFGFVSFSIATIQFLILITDYGFNYSATKSISIAGGNRELISRIFFRTMWAKLLLCIMCFMVLIVMAETLETYREIREILFINFLAVIGTVIYPLWLFQGLEKMGLITLFSIFSRGCVLISFYFLVRNDGDIDIAIFLLAIPNVLAGIFSLITICHQRMVSSMKFSIVEIRLAFIEGSHVFSSTLLTSMYTLMTPLVVGFVAGPVSVGYLNVANTVKQAICGVFSPLLQAYFPRINALYIADKQAAIYLAKKLLKYVLIMLFIISSGLLLFSDFIVKKAFGVQYLSAIPVLQILSFAPFFIMANSMMGLLLMIPRGDMKGYLRSILAGAIFSLVFVIPATYYFKENGAALTLLLVEVVVATFMLFRVRGYKNEK